MKEKFKSTAEIENSMKKLEDGIYKIQRGFAGIGIVLVFLKVFL